MIKIAHNWLPDKKDINQYINQIYDNGILTNNGPLVKRFEEEIKSNLNIQNILYVNSGHTAIMMALKAIVPQQGKVIITPFSFISTLQALLWNGHTPIFADIELQTLGIDPNHVEDILKKEKDIKAILATHLFGNICDVKALELLSTKYEVPIVYDAAHSFGINYCSQSIFEYGDISAVSFQAYKALHSVEGGALFAKDKELFQDLFNMRYFGLDLNFQPYNIGLNGKNSEIHAAFGLCSLKSWKERLERRKEIHITYGNSFSKLPINLLKFSSDLESNYSYFPIILSNKKEREQLEEYLLNLNIQTKRYFTPSLNTIKSLKIPYQKMPHSESISERILCIPIHSDLRNDEVQEILFALNNFQFTNL